MKESKKGFFDMKILIGLLILMAGILVLLRNLDYIQEVHILDYWPVILILLGLKKVFDPQPFRQVYWGLVILAIGVLFMLRNLAYLHFSVGDLWPVVLILLGIEIFRSGFGHSRFRQAHWHACCSGKDAKDSAGSFAAHLGSQSLDNDYINVSVVLGGTHIKPISKQLKGGSISAIMGGCEIDLRDADIKGNAMSLEITTIMGGVELWVPAHWQVVSQVSPLLGGVENKAVPRGENLKELFLKGTAIMGGVEVKN